MQLQDGEMGRGAFGTVRRGIFCGSQVAVKLTCRQDCTAPKEVEILSYLAWMEHPGILKLYACFLHEAKLLMVTELTSG